MRRRRVNVALLHVGDGDGDGDADGAGQPASTTFPSSAALASSGWAGSTRTV